MALHDRERSFKLRDRKAPGSLIRWPAEPGVSRSGTRAVTAFKWSIMLNLGGTAVIYRPRHLLVWDFFLEEIYDRISTKIQPARG